MSLTSEWVILLSVQDPIMPGDTQTVRTVLVRSDGHQESIKTDSRGHILFWQRVCVSSAQVQKLCWRLTVQKAMTLVGKLRRQLSLQVVAWLLLVTFSHIDSEDWK